MFQNAAKLRIPLGTRLLGGALLALLVLSACSGDDDSSTQQTSTNLALATTTGAVVIPSLDSAPESEASSTTATGPATDGSTATSAEPADTSSTSGQTTTVPGDATQPATTLAGTPTTDEVLDEDAEFRRAAAKSEQQVLIYFGTDIATAEATYGDLFDEISRRIVAVEKSRDIEELAELLAPDTYAGAFYDTVTGKIIVSATGNLSDLNELTQPAWEPYVTVALAN